VTYNFDPDQWYENQKNALDFQYHAGSLSEKEYTEALEKLDRSYEEMWKRLDGYFQIPD